MQERNKPKEPPKAPEKAPFFLPTLPGIEPRFNPAVNENKPESQGPQRRLENASASAESLFMQKLSQGRMNGNCKCIAVSITIHSHVAHRRRLLHIH
jgi:U3 small nucleolar RNA-associated protein 21